MSCFNTQPPEGGWSVTLLSVGSSYKFQHTAAQRRLGSSVKVDVKSDIGFNTQPPEGGWEPIPDGHTIQDMFQHTAARRRLAAMMVFRTVNAMFQHTAARRRLANNRGRSSGSFPVSTHSRPKAAGVRSFCFPFWGKCFNTQPPEGGWLNNATNADITLLSFNTQPPEGGWTGSGDKHTNTTLFQHTAARRRLGLFCSLWVNMRSFQHTAARRRLVPSDWTPAPEDAVSTHSRPKAAGNMFLNAKKNLKVSTHSRPKAAGQIIKICLWLK